MVTGRSEKKKAKPLRFSIKELVSLQWLDSNLFCPKKQKVGLATLKEKTLSVCSSELTPLVLFYYKVKKLKH